MFTNGHNFFANGQKIHTNKQLQSEIYLLKNNISLGSIYLNVY